MLPRRRSRRTAMTLLELVIVLAVLAVAATMYANSVLSIGRQRLLNREAAIAADAASSMLERMRSRVFRELVALYDHRPENDPQGAGSAPGPRFAVAELKPLPDSPDGLMGEIRMPEVEVLPGVWMLSEEADIPELGLPRDLNGDSRLDALDHTLDYTILPVRVRIDWLGPLGPRHFEITTMLTDVKG